MEEYQGLPPHEAAILMVMDQVEPEEAVQLIKALARRYGMRSCPLGEVRDAINSTRVIQTGYFTGNDEPELKHNYYKEIEKLRQWLQLIERI